MAQNSTVRAARRPKPGGRKTANRFAMLAGGDAAASADLSSPAADSATPDEDSGLIAGMSAIAADEAHRVVQLPVSEIAPHPFNHHSRSEPQPGDPKWEELLNAVRANGVRLPVLVVTREAFLAARPSAVEQIAEHTHYVLVYGHRRRVAALEAGRDTVPAVVDDATMADDGDLDAMATENLGRQDLSDLAQADLFARYSEIGLSQRAIAERLGVDQATVSRRLALKLLAPQLRKAVDEGELPSAEAAALAGALPYGPPRRWQKTKDPHQLSDQREAEQLQALQLVLARGMLATRAAERVIAERNARAKAQENGILIVEDPRTELGPDYHQYRVADFEPGTEVIGAINAASGALDLYARPVIDASPATPEEHTATAAPPSPPVGGQDAAPTAPEPAAADGGTAEQDGGPDEKESTASNTKRREEAAAAAQAQAQRREFCAALINQQPSNAELLKILVAQYLSGVAARSATSAVRALLRDWDAQVDGAGEKARNTRAWHRAVAAAELHTAELKDKAWDDDAVAHLTLLINRVGYEPTSWERRQLDAADV